MAVSDKQLKKIPEHSFKSPSVQDVFESKFDITWFANSEYPRELSIIPIENAKDDGTVIYKYNQDYFRCDDFKSEHAGKHIVFSGCSQTEGVGGNIETTWPHIVYENIKNKLDGDGFFNLSKAGWGWQKIVTNLLIYFDRYGFPDYLFVLLPDVCRFYDWDPREQEWVYTQRRYQHLANFVNEEDIHSKFATIEEHKKAFIDFVMGWKVFVAYCNLNNIKLLWSCWDYVESENVKKINIDGYVDISPEGFFNFVQTARPDGKLEQFEMRRRDGHEGTLAHEYWSQSFLKAIERKGWLNV